MTDLQALTPHQWALLDAEAQHLAFPDAFPIPSEQERHGLGTGDLVKLVFVLDEPPTDGPNAERMWVEVLARRDDGYEGRLTNQPTVIPGLSDGTRLAFDHRHVAGIALRRHEVTFAVDQRAVVTLRALARTVPPGWAAFDPPVDEMDSGWTVCAGDEPADHFAGDPAATTQAVTLGELAQRYPALVEVFQAGAGEWVYRPDHRRYVRVKPQPADGPATEPDPGDPDPGDPDPGAPRPPGDAGLGVSPEMGDEPDEAAPRNSPLNDAHPKGEGATADGGGVNGSGPGDPGPGGPEPR